MFHLRFWNFLYNLKWITLNVCLDIKKSAGKHSLLITEKNSSETETEMAKAKLLLFLFRELIVPQHKYFLIKSSVSFYFVV